MLRLRTDITLAPLTLGHARAMLRWMCDPSVSQNVGLRTEPTLDKTVAWIQNALMDDSICPFAILLSEEHVGNVVLDRIDRYLASARFSIYIGEPSARHSGVGRTAAFLALQEGFQGLQLRKIWLTVHARNFAALHTYTNLGFTLEGVLRDEFRLNGDRVPALYMGLLRDEFDRLAVERPEAG